MRCGKSKVAAPPMGNTHPSNTMFPRLLESVGNAPHCSLGHKRQLEPRKCWDGNFVNYTEEGPAGRVGLAGHTHTQEPQAAVPAPCGRGWADLTGACKPPCTPPPAPAARASGLKGPPQPPAWKDQALAGSLGPSSELSSILSARWPPTHQLLWASVPSPVN